MLDIESLEKNYISHAKVDYVGLWQIAGRIQDMVSSEDAHQVRRFTMDVVQELISRGILPGDYTEDGFSIWEGEQKSFLRRIESEWDQLSTNVPQLGEICWFYPRPK